SLSADPGGVYVYNADHEKVRPELAFTVSSQGEITHGSLMAEAISYHSVHSADFHPFSVPFAEPENLAVAEFVPTEDFERSANEVLEILISANTEAKPFSVTEGEQTAATAFQPRRGYLWPYRNQPLSNG